MIRKLKANLYAYVLRVNVEQLMLRGKKMAVVTITLLLRNKVRCHNAR